MAFQQRKFDSSLDKKIVAETADLETTRIQVGLFSYNEGETKMQISRENRNMNTGEWTFSKLGRMTYDEVEKVLPLIQKVFKQMPKPAEEKLPEE